MFKKIKSIFKTIRPIRHFLYIFAVILLYLLFIEVVSNMVNQRRLEKDIKDWFENAVNYSTFADIDHTDTALRLDWRTDLYIHEFEIASPDPEYILPLVFVDTIRASTQFYDLFGGVKASPDVQLRDGILNITAGNTKSNLTELTIGKSVVKPSFLPFIDIKDLNFFLMNCSVNIDYPLLKTTIPLNGRMKLKDNQLELKAISENIAFLIDESLMTERVYSSIVTNNLNIELNTKKIHSCDISLKNIPARIINLLFDEMPQITDNLNLNGKIQTISNSLVFTGILENQATAELPRFLNIRISTNKDFIADLKFFHIEISDNSTTLISLKAEKNIVSEWEPFTVYFDKLNLNELLTEQNQPWIDSLIAIFPAINIQIRSAGLFDFRVNDAFTDIVSDENGKHKISLEGDVAGGQIKFLAKGIDFSESNTPETIMATLQVKNPADSLLAFSKNIPRILDCTPTSGTGEIALIYKREKENSKTDNLMLQINLKDVTIPALGSGKTIETLAELPKKMHELSKLCARSDLKTATEETDLISSFPEIKFHTLSVIYEIDSEKQTVLSSLTAESNELGKVTGTFTKSADKDFKLTLKFKEIPTATLKAAKLSEQAFAAIRDLEKEGLFEINLFETPEKTITENSYMENGYRLWLEKNTN